jgi:hypothetical protein
MFTTLISSQGLGRAASISETDFEFTGNACAVQCTTFQAAFVSPRVHALFQQDKTLDSFFVDCERFGLQEERIFELLERLLNGFELEIETSELPGLLSLATFLGNTELLNHFIHDEDPLDKSTICSRLRTKSIVGRSMEEEIEFAASHFYELDVDPLDGIDISIIERIVSSKALRLANEDSLLDFICSVGRGKEIVVLLRYLRIEYLSSDGIEVFINCLRDLSIDAWLWDRVCRRLRLRVSGSDLDYSSIAMRRFVGKSQRLEKTIHIQLNETKPLDGLISYLTRKHGGNVQEKGIVTITSKSADKFNDDPRYALNSVANLTSGSFFRSENEPDEWVCWDFRKMRVRPTHYTIRSRGLRSWILEGSVDGERWTEVSRQTESRHFRDLASSWFPVSPTAEFRFIRLTQTDRNLWGNSSLALRAVEFFGSLAE